MKSVLVVMGTRPEVIKLCPLVRELQKREVFSVRVCATGQHREMTDSALQAFGIHPDYSLDVLRKGQNASGLVARILVRLDEVLETEKPEVVVVQGDTASAFAGALAAFHRKIPVAHVEAGLRTYHLHSPFPEEYYRESISLMTEYHFAPTATARRNLIREGRDEQKIAVTGNTVIDALRFTLSEGVPMETWNFPKEKKLVIFTAHRRENLGEPIRGMFRALRRLTEAHPDILAVCPLHHNPEVRSAAMEILRDCTGVVMVEPPEIVSFHRLMAKSTLILTDSGGIQEEATALGIPTVVMRYSTERQEGLHSGNLRLAGSGEEGIFTLADSLLKPGSELYESMKKPCAVFGDGRASARIADTLEKWI